MFTLLGGKSVGGKLPQNTKRPGRNVFSVRTYYVYSPTGLWEKGRGHLVCWKERDGLKDEMPDQAVTLC